MQRKRIRKLRPALLVVVVVVALSGLLFPGAPAQAGHATCVLAVNTPAVRFESGFKYVRYSSSANCASGVVGRLNSHLQRHRWWGWQEVFEASQTLSDFGNRTLVREVHCPGSFISAGTWTFRTLAAVQTYHPGTSIPWRSVSGTSGTMRTGCH